MAAGTSAVAIIGALTGVASLGWQIFKYLKEGPVLRVRVNQGMEWLNPSAGQEHEQLALVAVANVGSQTTTLTQLVLLRYKHRFDRLLRRKPLETALVHRPAGHGLPYKLEVGDEWAGLVDQPDLVEQVGKGGYLYAGVIHTFGKRPKLFRVYPPVHPALAF